MRLQICEALIGTPVDDDRVKLTLEGGRTLYIVFRPHNPWDRHIWAVDEEGEWPKELVNAADVARTTNSFKAYLDPFGEIAVGCPLSLVLVPEGNYRAWPRTNTEQRVLSIELL